MSCTCACHCCAPRWKGEPEIGTVLAFQKKFPDSSKLYGYVALHAANGRWYLTQSGHNYDCSPMGWSALRAFIGDGACSKVVKWEDIP